jgi:hypothetical protein
MGILVLRGAFIMSNLSQSVQDVIQPSDRSEVPPIERSSPTDEMDVLNDDVMIETDPDRPCGTIRVKLVYDGRSTPIPAEDPRSE